MKQGNVSLTEKIQVSSHSAHPTEIPTANPGFLGFMWEILVLAGALLGEEEKRKVQRTNWSNTGAEDKLAHLVKILEGNCPPSLEC